MVLSILTTTTNAAVTQSPNKVYLGLSGYPTSTSQVQNIINTMQANGLNTYRMSFNPEWSRGPHPYHQEYIQYFLDHSNFNIIVDRNHLYPPQESTASAARSNWATARNSIFDVLKAFPNNPRVMVELINEYVSDDFYSRMQSLVTEVRNAGYTNTLVVNKWNQPWTVINDPLDATIQGYHYYFNSWSPSGAISQMQTAQSKGIKVINTEIGADYNEYSSYTTSTVNELNQFIAQCTSMGIGNTVWMNENLNNMPRYQQLGLDFPSVTAPSQPNPTTTPRPTTSPTPTPTATPRPTTTPTPTTSPTPNPTSSPTPELNYPTQTWQRLWTTQNGQYLGQTDETTIQFDTNWGTGAAAFGRTDGIMFTSSRTISLTGGTYTFTVGSDDGFRLYIDGQLVMQSWSDRSYNTNSYTTTLTSGSHKFRLDFYENSGNARVSFAYQTTPNPTTTPKPTAPPNPTNPPSNDEYSDNFESKADFLKNWFKTTTWGEKVAQTNAKPYDGSYAACFTTNGLSRGRENAYISKSVNMETISAKGYFSIKSTTSRILSDNGDRLYLISFTNSQGEVAYAGIRRENGVNKWVLYANGAKTSSAIPISADKYYNVELRWDANQHLAEMYVDGSKILELTNYRNSGAVTNVNMGIISTYNVQNALTVTCDNFILSKI